MEECRNGNGIPPMFHIGTEQFAFGRPTIPNRADWVAVAGMSQLAGTVHDVPGPFGPRAVALRMGSCLGRTVFRFVVSIRGLVWRGDASETTAVKWNRPQFLESLCKACRK
jgi:hypothetical protein